MSLSPRPRSMSSDGMSPRSKAAEAAEEDEIPGGCLSPLAASSATSGDTGSSSPTLIGRTRRPRSNTADTPPFPALGGRRRSSPLQVPRGRAGKFKPMVGGSKPPALSLRNSILMHEEYNKVTEVASNRPGQEEIDEFEKKVNDYLPISQADRSHFAKCFRADCPKKCAEHRKELVSTGLRWYKVFELMEKSRNALSPDDFHVKSLVDHVLVAVLLDRGEVPCDEDGLPGAAGKKKVDLSADW